MKDRVRADEHVHESALDEGWAADGNHLGSFVKRGDDSHVLQYIAHLYFLLLKNGIRAKVDLVKLLCD